MNLLKERKYLFVAGAILVLLVVWFAFGRDSEENVAIYATPKVGTFQVDITTSGELQAKRSTSIRGPAGIRDFRIYQVKIQKMVDEGTIVKKGDFVAELDRSEISTKLKDEQLNLQEDETNFESAQLDSSLTLSEARNNLVNLNYALEEAKIAVEQSKYESPAKQRQVKISYDKAQRSLKQAQKKFKTQKKKAEANLQRRQNNLNQQRREVERIKKAVKQFTIYAPENGMVIYKRDRGGGKLTEGGQISAWDPTVAELPDFSVMNSETYVNEVDIQKVRVGQNVDIGLDAIPDKKLTGQVTRVANIGEQRPNSDSKVFAVTIEVNESDSTLRPAMTTSNTIHVNSIDSALYVPLETVHTTDSLTYVFKKNGLSTVMQQVIIGMINENDVVIKEGVSPTDRLYLSTPGDTTNISKKYLPQKVLTKYAKEKKKVDSIKTKKQEPNQRNTPSRSTDRRNARRMRRGR